MFSNDIAIRVTNLSKRYEIYATPRDRLKQFILPRLNRWTKKLHKDYFSAFWALQDVSFEVKKGEAIGIIGQNGSGKSTLLQMICGTLTPTDGSIEINGRVAALLELGSGFNPEFTGRENVYMNASILGLSFEEIDAAFDDIAAFANIGQFIEQPVKTYSSGMSVRLAFAVVAHVNADILVIDEALSVGDAIFTQRCMQFIRKFQENGTLIFVSHDIASVQNLCESAMWLKKGQTQMMGPSKKVAESYLQYTLQKIYGDTATLSSLPVSEDPSSSEFSNEPQIQPLVLDYDSELTITDNCQNASGWKTGDAEVLSISLKKLDSDSSDIFKGGEKVQVIIHAKAHSRLAEPILGFVFRDKLGQDLFGENTLPFTDLRPSPIASGQEFIGRFTFDLPMLPNGAYTVMTSVANGSLYDHVQHHWLHDALIIEVSSSKIRYGLVGVAFQKAELEIIDEHKIP